MPAAAREGDKIATGHSGATETKLGDSLQQTVKVNGKHLVVIGTPTRNHSTGSGNHIAYVTGGSSTVKAEGIAASRVGDAVDNGTIIEGSGNVFIGG